MQDITIPGGAADRERQKWVSCWGNATSITDRREATYARNLTLRYPLRMPFDGTALRLRFSNLTGTEPVTLDRVYVADSDDHDATRRTVTFGGSPTGVIAPGEELQSDGIPFGVRAGATIDVSFYLAGYTQMNAGTLVTGPLSRGYFCYGDHAGEATLPPECSRHTQWFHFLGTADVLTSPRNHALICYGDSITAQSWPDWLALRAWDAGRRDVAVIRRAVCGTRVLRQYDCATYQAYGLKGATRFPIEMRVSGASAVIIQHGINDIIHPVGTDINPFRPWNDMPTAADLEQGIACLYADHARQLGLSVWSGTLLPIRGWRTYTEDRDRVRREVNDWLRSSPLFDGCIDFDRALRSGADPSAFAPEYDSGDHLHPSEEGYKAMAACVPDALL